jgi:hypothetical protein
MADAITFVMRPGAGREDAALYHDVLTEAARKSAVYALRIDRLPAGHEWQGKNLGELCKLYARDKAAGTLPPSNVADPPKDKKPTTVAAGQRRARMSLPGRHLPPEPYPAPDGLRARPDAGAYIPRLGLVHEV